MGQNSKFEHILTQLLAATTSTTVRAVLHELGDHPDVQVDQPFGHHGLYWHPFGDNESNISTIGLGTQPGRSLTERITNAQDAILDAQVDPKVPTPKTPWKAAEKWFGRPPSTADTGLFKWDTKRIETKIALVLLDGDESERPTIDVIDEGVGLAPERFPKTILSLQGGNKIKNRHLIGAFGQGGSATLAFAQYCLIVSRSKSQPEIVGFTVIRVLGLGMDYKEDCYAYLVQKDDKGQSAVPSFSMPPAEELRLYNKEMWPGKIGIINGTLVRHIGYALPGLAGGLSPSATNLWHYLNVSVFDPLLPFRVVDMRATKMRATKPRFETISGSRNRLMKLAQKIDDENEKERGSEAKYYRPMEYMTPHGGTEPSIGIELWVVVNHQVRAKGGRKMTARSHELYTRKYFPIIGTLNGQNQGELPSRIIRDAGLVQVANHMIVHVDASKIDSKIRRGLFSTSREGFKDGPILVGLQEYLRKILEEDENLHELEREFSEKLVKRETQETKAEVKAEISRLLREAGWEATAEGAADSPGSGDERPTKPRRPSQGVEKAELLPLPTLPYPQVTKFDIVRPTDNLSVRLNDHKAVWAETDAHSSFDDPHGRVFIRAEPDGVLAVHGKTPLIGGRVRWRLKPTAEAKVGQKGTVTAGVTLPNGTQFTSSVAFEILEPLVVKANKKKGKIPPFEIIALDPFSEADEEQWGQIWPDLEDKSAEDKAQASYKARVIDSTLHVFYSVAFGPYRTEIDRLRRNPGRAGVLELFSSSYEVWIGYHAFLQHEAKPLIDDVGIDEELQERLLDEERQRVATMQVKQAMRVAELKAKLAISTSE